MKLQRLKSRTVGKTPYYKWLITLPSKAIEALGWKEGDDLTAEVKGGSLRLTKGSPK